MASIQTKTQELIEKKVFELLEQANKNPLTINDVRQFLTEIHQAVIDEAVEKMQGMKRVPAIGRKDGKIIDYTTERDKAHNQALDDTIKALQDSK